MSDFVEKVTLDLGGTAVDGSAAAGLGKTDEGVKGLKVDLDKLSTTTGAEATLGKTSAAVDGLGASTGKTGAGVKGLQADLQKLVNDLGLGSDRAKLLTGDLQSLAKDIGLGSAFSGMTVGVVALGAAAVAAGAVIGAEMVKIIASTIAAAEEVDRYTKQIASAYGSTDDWASSMDRASRVIPGLQKIAILTGSSLGELATSFRSLSLLTNASNADVLRVTESLTVMAKTAGLSADALISQIQRAALTGQMPLRGEAGREIAMNLFPGLSPEAVGAQLKAAQDAGTLLDLLTAKIGDQSDKAKSLADDWGTLGGSWTKISASLKAEIGAAWEPLRVLFADIRNFAMADEFREIAKNIGGVGQAMVGGELANWVSLWVGLRETTKNYLSVLAPVYELMLKIGVLKPPAPADVSGFLTSSHKGFPGTDTMTQLDIEGIKKGRDEWEKLFETLDREHTLAGLTGIDKQLTEINVKAAKQTEEVEKNWPGAYEDASAKAKALALIQDTASKDRTTALNAEAEKQATVIANQDRAIGKYKEWVALFTGQMDLAGLDGLALALATTNLNFDKSKAKIIEQTAAVAAFDAAAVAAKPGLLAMNEAARQTGLSLDISKAAEEFSVGLEKITSLSKTSDLDRINSTALRAQSDLDALDAKLLKEVHTQAELVALDQSTAVARKAIEEKRAQDSALIIDRQSGNWDAYYKDLVKKARDMGAGIVEAEQASAKKVADDMYANASTIADGVNAALLKIRSELKTEGQIWSDYLTGIWGGITTGLGTVLKTLETGTGTIKDTLKGILNSLLDSFNTMVVEMVKKWLLGQDQMKAGTSGSGGLSSLFAGAGVASSIDAQGNVVYHGGTIDMTPKGQGTQGVVTQQQPSGVGLGSVIGGAAAGASLFSSTGGSGFAQVVGTVGGAALGGGLAAIGAALIAGIEIPVLGWIAAAVGVILIGLSAILKPNTETKIFGREFAPQIKAVAEGIQSSLVDVFATSLLPDAAGFAKSLNDRIKTYLQSANFFEVHAGSSEDITKDIQTLLSGIIPTELLHTLIGQQRTGGQDVAGISGASTYGGALDPNAPINKMLTDLGLTAGKIQQLAGQIDTMAPADWMKMLSDLVGVVSATGTLGKLLSQTYADTIAGADAEAAKSPAGKLADRLAGVTDLLQAVSFYTGTEQITKGQEAITAAQQFYNDAKTAMLQLSAMAKQVTQDVADSTKQVLDSLKSPAELAAQSVVDLGHDYDRMRFAANPEDMAAAWASAKTDFMAVAGELVNRIKQIRSVLDDIHTLQDAMLTGPGANATTDPWAWLAQNMIAMEKYRVAMTAATPGSPEQIAAATSFAGLIRDRYQMEIELIGRVKDAMRSVNQTIDEALYNIDVGAAVNDQGKATIIEAKMQELYAQIQMPGQTPEAIAQLVSQITGLGTSLLNLHGKGITTTLGQGGNPESEAMIAWVKNMLELVRGAAKTNLGDQGTIAQIDISTLGRQLAGAETIMAAALTKVQTDLDALIWHFGRAGEFMTGKLNDWGVEIQGQLNLLGPVLTTMVTNFTDVNTALTGGGTGKGGGKHGPDGFIPVIADATAAVGDFAAQLRGTGAPGASSAKAGNAGGVSVTANVTVNQGGEVSLEAIWEGLGPAIQEELQANNIKVVRHIQGNA